MNLSLGELRNAMHQRIDPDTVRFRTDTFFEDFKQRASNTGDVAELFHENSKHVPGNMGKPNRTVGEFEQEPYLRYVQVNIAPDYRGNELVELPEPTDPSEGSAAEVLRSRRSPTGFTEDPIGIERLSDLLFYAAGVTGRIEVDDGALTKSLRAYPSAGALYPVEIYVAVRDCDGLDEGLYYYAQEHHGLRTLEVGKTDGLADAFVAGAIVSNAPIVVILTGAFWRSKAKYGPRGYRYTLQESGHVAGNLGIVAGSLGLCSIPIGGFYDDPLNEWVGVDGVDEAVLYAVVVGTPSGEDSDGE